MAVSRMGSDSGRSYRIALLSCTWDVEFMTQVTDGILRRLGGENVKIHLFQTSDTEEWNLAAMRKEAELFSLFDPQRYDAMIIAANASSNFDRIMECAEAFRTRTGRPIICVSTELKGLSNVGVNNWRALYLMTRHLIEAHGASSFRFVAGPENVPDSDRRLQGFLACLRDHNIPFDPAQLYHGNFTVHSGIEAYRYFRDRGTPSVRAIVFANDGMAVGYCDAAREDGLVPGTDFLFTGFDNAGIADGYLPAVSTVGQDLEDAAYRAADLIMTALKHPGKAMPVTSDAAPASLIRADAGTEKLIFRSSCGCPWHRDYREDYEELNRRFDARAGLNNRLRMAVQELITLSSPEELQRTLPRFLEFLGLDDHFALVLNSSPWKYSSISDLCGYEDHMIFCSDTDFFPDFNSSDLYPASWKESTGGKKIMVFLPLYDRNISLGYLITYLQDHLYELLYFRAMTGNLSIAVESVRQRHLLGLANKKLDRLYITDPLTGIYNRFGFSRFQKRYFESHDGDIAVVIADLDSLKQINDRGGHNDGDFALIAAAEALQKAFGEDSIYVRMGGDEFLVLTRRFEPDQWPGLTEIIKEHLRLRNSQRHLPLPLSLSIGYVLNDETEDLHTLISRADSQMYSNKKDRISSSLSHT